MNPRKSGFGLLLLSAFAMAVPRNGGGGSRDTFGVPSTSRAVKPLVNPNALQGLELELYNEYREELKTTQPELNAKARAKAAFQFVVSTR